MVILRRLLSFSLFERYGECCDGRGSNIINQRAALYPKTFIFLCVCTSLSMF